MIDEIPLRTTEDNVPPISPAEVDSICKLVGRLAELRWRGCEHLSVENFAEECFHSLLSALILARRGRLRILLPESHYEP